jgi:hypothetical protein
MIYNDNLLLMLCFMIVDNYVDMLLIMIALGKCFWE